MTSIILLTIIAITLLSIAVGSLLYTHNARVKKFLCAFAGVLILCGGFTFYLFDDVVGTPKSLLLSEQFELLWFNVDIDSGYIYVWVKEPGETAPTTYQLPFTSELAQQLSEMREGLERNIEVVGEFQRSERDGDDSDHTPGDQLVFTERPPNIEKDGD